MNRQLALLAGLGLVLLVVVFYLLGWKPKAEELTAIEEQIEAAQVEQATLQARIESLEAVRAAAPEIEAALAASESVIPREAALPSALRQLQLAADDSGVQLLSISPGRPAALAEGSEVASIDLALSIEGGYFQIIDFLRRVEDPAIVPRAILFRSAAFTAATYPTLAVSLGGEMFAIVPAPVAPVEEVPAEAPVEAPVDGATDAPVEEETAA